MFSFPIHAATDITLSRCTINNQQCISILIKSAQGIIELEVYGAYPYPVISADENLPIVTIKEEE